tara:strand:+ start:27630 stop:28019 length:390 start_codon:yes stop_codon:yes gene_type:complete
MLQIVKVFKMGNKETQEDGWNEYSKLVLAELLRLNENDNKLRDTITESNGKLYKALNEINIKLARLETFEREIDLLDKWKADMEEIGAPTTLKQIKEDVDSLMTFKTVATTVWAIVQIGFGIIIAIYYK